MNEIADTLRRIAVTKKKPLCFILDFKETDDKISAHFYDTTSLELIKKIEESQHVTTLDGLSESVRYSDGKWELRTTDYVPKEYPNSVLLLQSSNLRSDGYLDLETGGEKYISSELHKKWKHSQVKTGNIVLAITGVIIGVASLIPENFPEANLSQALGYVVLKKNLELNGRLIEISPEYILTYLNSKFGKTQFLRYGGFRAQHCGLSTREVKSVLVPLFDEKVQNNIVEQTKKHRFSAYSYEKALLEKTEDMTLLLERVLEEPMPRHSQHIFACYPEGDRIDCLCNSPDIQNLNAYLLNLEAEGKITLVKPEDLLAKDRDITKKIYNKNEIGLFKYVDIENVDKNVGIVEGFTEDFLLKLPTRARQFIRENDVLIPTPIGSTKGVCIVPKEFEGQICSTGFLVISTESLDEALFYYAVFKSNIVQKQFYHFQSGCVQPSISYEMFIKKMKIPVPKGSWKETFQVQAKQSRNELLQLRESYASELEKARETFETLVLGAL
ncbi:MAG TPA: hypothetical protein VK536_00635 [Candidatus Limnocylindrales bacterium]|nr:hypothetical protein [Candidatus Limnocylindrales bacterium]